MSPEDLERSVEFLVRQQAAFEVRQAAFEARQTAFDTRLDKLVAIQERTDNTVALIGEALVSAINRLDQLTDRVNQLTDRVNQLTDRVDQLANRVDAIGERLDAFIVVVERYITRNGNGHKPQ